MGATQAHPAPVFQPAPGFDPEEKQQNSRKPRLQFIRVLFATESTILARRKEVVKELQPIERQWVSTTMGSRKDPALLLAACCARGICRMWLRRVPKKPNNKG